LKQCKIVHKNIKAPQPSSRCCRRRRPLIPLVPLLKIPTDSD